MQQQLALLRPHSDTRREFLAVHPDSAEFEALLPKFAAGCVSYVDGTQGKDLGMMICIHIFIYCYLFICAYIKIYIYVRILIWSCKYGKALACSPYR